MITSLGEFHIRLYEFLDSQSRHLGYGTYFFFASLMILMGFWTYFCVPETKGTRGLHPFSLTAG